MTNLAIDWEMTAANNGIDAGSPWKARQELHFNLFFQAALSAPQLTPRILAAVY